MKICVLNGSPKGDNSITLQTIHYIKNRYPEHEWTILPVGKKIRYYETHMEEALDAIKSSDLILFSYPVYTFMAPAQLHRFMELLKEEKADLSGIFVTQVTTSKHFYDITAHGYIRENCEDMNAVVIDGLSADMNDLTTREGQRDALAFWEMVLFTIRQKKKRTAAEGSGLFSGEDLQKASKTAKKQNSRRKRVSVVTNMEPGDHQLEELIQDFCQTVKAETKVYNILEAGIKGGCISCFHCASKGECIYKDGFTELLRDQIQKADAIVYAFTIKDHSMGASFKLFDDRQFCNGHRTVMMGRPIGYLVNGDYGKEKNLQTVIQGRAQVGHNYLPGAAVDHRSLMVMCENLEYAMEHHYTPPQNFYGVGGMVIFRDLIYLMGGLMQADYRFYKEKGFFRSMPHRQQKTRLMMKLVGTIFADPKLVKRMGGKISEGMLAPYTKVLKEDSRKQEEKSRFGKNKSDIHRQ